MLAEHNGNGKEIPNPHESKIYSEFSHLYDKIFSRFFSDRITAVIRNLNIQPGAKVLEVGVGTGLSMDAYPAHCEVTGIDLAPGMLERGLARKNVLPGVKRGRQWRFRDQDVTLFKKLQQKQVAA